MREAVLTGLVFGSWAGISPGPLLTLVIQQSLRHGVLEGAKVAIAPLLTDLPIVLASICLIRSLSGHEHVLGAISLLGGIYVLFLAYESFRSGPIDLSVAAWS